MNELPVFAVGLNPATAACWSYSCEYSAMGLHHTDPSRRPFWSLHKRGRISSDRAADVSEWRVPSVWSVLGWILIGLTFGGSILSYGASLISYGASLIAGIVTGGPVAGPWWWAAIGCLVALFELIAIVSIRRRHRSAAKGPNRLFAIRRLELPPQRHWFAHVALSWRLLNSAFRGRSDSSKAVRIAPIWCVLAVPIALHALPDATPAAVGALVCGETSANLPVLKWCHDAMAFAESRTWPPVASNVTAAAGLIVSTKIAVWLSVLLSISGVVSAILQSRESRLASASPAAWRRFALWSRLNRPRPVPLLAIVFAIVALYDTIVRLAFVGAMAVVPPVVTTENLTAFVLWAVAGGVFVYLVSRAIGYQIVERRVDALLHQKREQDPLFNIK